MPATSIIQNFGPLETTTKNKLLNKKKTKWGVKNGAAGNPWKREDNTPREDDAEVDDKSSNLGSVIFDALKKGKFKTKKRKRQIAKGTDPYDY